MESKGKGMQNSQEAKTQDNKEFIKELKKGLSSEYASIFQVYKFVKGQKDKRGRFLFPFLQTVDHGGKLIAPTVNGAKLQAVDLLGAFGANDLMNIALKGLRYTPLQVFNVCEKLQAMNEVDRNGYLEEGQAVNALLMSFNRSEISLSELYLKLILHVDDNTMTKGKDANGKLLVKVYSHKVVGVLLEQLPQVITEERKSKYFEAIAKSESSKIERAYAIIEEAEAVISEEFQEVENALGA